MLEELKIFNKVSKAEYYLAELEKNNKNEYLKLNGVALKYDIDKNTEKFIFLCSYRYNPKTIGYVMINLEDKIEHKQSDLETTIKRLGNSKIYKEWIEFLDNPNIMLEDGYDMDNLAKLNFLVLEAARRGSDIGDNINSKRHLECHMLLMLASLNFIDNEDMNKEYAISFNYEDIQRKNKIKKNIDFYKNELGK